MKSLLNRSIFALSLWLLGSVSLSAQTTGVSKTPVAGLARPDDPVCIVIGFDAKPERRTEFHAYLKGEGSKALDGWKAAGKISDYQIVFQNFDECNGAPDALLIVTFAKFVDSYGWTDVEIESPSGLTPAGVKLAKARYSVIVERISHRRVDTPSTAAFEVSLYTTTKDKAAYRKFAREYPTALFENWIGQGAVSEYSIYVPLQPYGHPWDSMIILGYKDAAAHAGSNKVKTKSYADLANDVAYNSQAVTRDAMRTKVNECFYHPISRN